MRISFITVMEDNEEDPEIDVGVAKPTIDKKQLLEKIYKRGSNIVKRELEAVINPMLALGRTAALILARGGSKGIYLKNLQNVGEVSLLARAIQTAKLVGLKATVSTEHPLIALEALRNGGLTFHRSKITASDWAPSIWAASEFIVTKPDVSVLVLLQATSPFIQAKNIRAALEKINSFDCVFSVVRSYKLRWRNLNGRVVPMNFDPHARPRRQDWSGELLETGGFYVSRRHLIEKGYFQSNNCSILEVSTIESLEIDAQHDLQIANVLLNANLV